jgi:hypothetical protein
VQHAVGKRITAFPEILHTDGDDPGEDRITTAHRAKISYIYARQSSVAQVRQNQKNIELQYHLVDRALQMG